MIRGGERGTVVVDVTYGCNATCGYCRWGDAATPGRTALGLDSVLIPEETLEILGAKRVVLSGGEPTTHPELHRILRHYSGLVGEVAVITNGYTLDGGSAASMMDSGATGITVSLDSVDPAESFLVRRTPPALHRLVLRGLGDVAGMGGRLELGINSTVSSVTANWLTVSGLLRFGLDLGADFVKFQPVFDDGYASANSAWLLLGMDSVEPLLHVASRLDGLERPPTNPSGFWSDVAVLAGGGRLKPSGCALGWSDALVSGGGMCMCYWVGSSHYGRPTAGNRASYDGAASRFGADKLRCTVGFHCFCNQGMGHVWGKG